jgi:hypothetical protein
MGFWDLRDIYECVCCYDRRHGMVPFVVKEFWALWENIMTFHMAMLLREAFNFMLLCGNV